jgi:predicted RNA-binding protein YlxR (DUF448 family)
VPLRRCVGCGRIAPKSELVRIALVREEAMRRSRAVCDRDGKLGGRGAYLCRGASPDSPAQDCLTRASKRGGIARALRSAVTLDAKLVESIGR